MWHFWLDVGGTFTDCLARTPAGRLLCRKVLSSGVTKGRVASASLDGIEIEPAEPYQEDFWSGYTLRGYDSAGQCIGEARVVASNRTADGLRLVAPGVEWSKARAWELAAPEEAPLLAIRLFLGLRLDQPIPPCQVRLGTTRGTNALLTRRGAKTAFVTTRGFADILLIGYQNRPKLFELAIRKEPPLFALTAEIEERIAADGTVLVAPSDEQIRSALGPLKDAGIEALAVCLLHSYANARHEKQVERIAQELGFDEVSVSSAVSPLMKMVPRGDTTVVDAYLNPVLKQYIDRLKSKLPQADLRLMTSAGGLASPAAFSGKDSILSGPAGGVVGFSKAAEAAGFRKAIGFDMGGTSTDVARYDGRFEHEHETQKAGVRIVAPMLSIETVAAGGGSICRFDGVKLVVGPESASADPGPACYGRGGPLTITDCNLVLGRVLADHFPFPLDASAVQRRLAEVVRESKSGYEPLALAAGFVRIANASMAQAIRSISLAKGYDPREYVLVAFGSAGPQHASAMAREIGIRQVLVHPEAGVLSALGIGRADVFKQRVRGVYLALDACQADLPAIFGNLESQAREEVTAEAAAAEIEIGRELDLRYQGTDAALTIAEPADGRFAAAFEAEHRRRYGYIHENRPLEVVAVRVKAIGKNPVRLDGSRLLPDEAATPSGEHRLFLDNQFQSVPLFERERLRPGARLEGPAVVVESLTTTIVDPGFELTVLSGGELLLTDRLHDGDQPLAKGQVEVRPASATSLDPVLLEITSNHFTAIATQMGITLRNTSLSVNVKERLDFSCAIFTAEGDLVVNAPHIPVHLGAMSETVKAILADNPDIQAGDALVTNDPYRGGSHLPDVTVVTPVFDASLASDRSSAIRPLFFTASRAHHAEIGGITPGSMPPFSKTLAEEGVLIRNFKLVSRGAARFDELRAVLAAGPYPSRSIDANLADITAQLAANQQGAGDLLRMVERFSWPTVEAYMRHIQSAAEQKLRAVFARLPRGARRFADHLDDGTLICVAVTLDGETATIDFSGTGPVSPGNLNANRSIVTAAVIYVLRLLVGEEMPLNQGILAPVRLVLPPCLLNPPSSERPEECPAVVGGNVETSQRVVDCLLGAFGLAAASLGTMNNVLFGDGTFGYYETICGGSGATASAPGADAVHTHMTNTRITDPEVLEARYPVRLQEFSIRRGSGGQGVHRGGNGVTRRLEFLGPLTLSILSQRRGPYAPYGMSGGEPGACGRNLLTRADGRVQPLPGMSQLEVQPGDMLTVETPGGGGWGNSEQSTDS